MNQLMSHFHLIFVYVHAFVLFPEQVEQASQVPSVGIRHAEPKTN